MGQQRQKGDEWRNREKENQPKTLGQWQLSSTSKYWKNLILHDDDLGFQYFLYSSFHFKSNHVSTPFQSCKAYTPQIFR